MYAITSIAAVTQKKKSRHKGEEGGEKKEEAKIVVVVVPITGKREVVAFSKNGTSRNKIHYHFFSHPNTLQIELTHTTRK